jgi:hypothetical protein
MNITIGVVGGAPDFRGYRVETEAEMVAFCIWALVRRVA